MSDEIALLWQRIESWLQRYAPNAHRQLVSGASEHQLQEAEAAFGLPLPEDFKASCRLHNGGYSIHLVSDMTILSLDEMMQEWHMLNELDEIGNWSDAGLPYYFQPDQGEWQVGPIQPVWWHRGWIPIGRDLAGNVCCLDLVPAPGGSVGQVIDRDHEVGPSRVLAASFFEVLSTLADDLEAGAYQEKGEGLIWREHS